MAKDWEGSPEAANMLEQMERDEQERSCAFCGGHAEGLFSIHRDGCGVGPEVDLCTACGGESTPTTAEIWDRIAQPSDDEWAYRPSSPPAEGQGAPR